MDCAYSDYLFKVLLVGDPAVGKSSIISKFTDCVFTEEYTQTFNANYKITKLAIEDSIIKAHIWDSPGDDFYKTLAYYCGGIDLWIDNIKCIARKNMNIILCGNKSEPECSRNVSTEDGLKVSLKYNIPLFETSAKENLSIYSLFNFAFATLKDAKQK